MPDDMNQLYHEGLSAFSRARSRAFIQDIVGHIRGQPTELLSFADIRARLRLHIENYRGIQDIPLDQIVGSVGRYHEFTRRFLPTRTVERDRWSRVYARAVGMAGLPPIELYKVDDVYFVRDGNHRVSVARTLGAKSIQAEVTELLTPIGFRPDLSRQEIDATACYAEFLDQMRPIFPDLSPGAFRISHPTAYNDLIGHINLFHCVEYRCDAPLAEAAAKWFRCVYTPVVHSIRKYGIMTHLFPQCTETDLYLWVTEHLRECEQELLGMAQPTPLNGFLTQYLADHNIPLPAEALGCGDTV